MQSKVADTASEGHPLADLKDVGLVIFSLSSVPTSCVAMAYSSGTLDNERLFGFEAAREKTKLKRLFPDYVFINNLDSFNGSYLVKFFLEQKYGVLPESVTEIVDHLPETQPEGESEEFSYTAKQYPKKSGSTKSGSTKSGSTKSGSTKSGSNSSLMGVGSNFWDPEDERYGEVDIGALSVEEYIQMIDIPNTEGRLDDVHGIKMVVPKCCEDPSTFIKSVQQCYTVIFDISEDPSEICEAHTALDVMLQEASKKGKDACPRKFILVTSAVTWSLTKKRKGQNIVEEDIKRRNIYPKKYSLHVALEDYVMEAGAKYPFIAKRAKAKQVCDLDLAVLSRSLIYLEMERTWNYGNLPDNVVAQMIRLRLNEANSLKCGYVLDGYPKTFEQATLLFPDMKFAWPDNYDKPQPVPKQESNEIKGDQDVEIPIPKPALDCNPIE
ncbi:hypothetical protein AAG570_008187 [Ranatra chinensis]|uniref:Uncharacterized protein n=1 Tax=Ranatra chinensis TaxID=642074 RepID=A0ABD0XV36_9HEMI